MRITHYIFSTLLAAIALPMLSSCDDIDEADRLIEVDPKLNRVVLVEEFSGQRCTNCPDGADLLETIAHRFGTDTVIVVSIHCGVTEKLGIAESNTNANGLVTDFGEERFTAVGRPALPKAIFDRKTPTTDMDQWLTNIINVGWGEPMVKLALENSYNAADGVITVKVKGQANGDFEGNVHVWLTEDNIVGWQSLAAGGYDKEHVFSHIFRASLTPIEGTPVTYTADAAEQVLTIKAAEKWNLDNMAVVAFVDNASGVHQTIKASLLAE